VRRHLTLAAAAVAALVVVLAAVLLARGGDEPSPPGSAGTASAEPTTYPDDVVEVVVLVDEGTDPADSERAVGLITDATRMWESGLAGLSEDGEPLELAVRTESLAPGGTLELRDPEVVFVIAGDADTADGSTLEVADAGGTGCTTYADAFALGSWTGLPDFASHHRLPEGTLVTSCGDDGQGRVCLAVNATFTAGGVDPMEAFGLVGDELGHCLGQAGRPSRA
jgi:hypothetical protein